MLKYRLDAYMHIKDTSKTPPYNGVCHAGLTVVDLLKSFPKDGLELTKCSTYFEVEETVTKLKEYFNPDDVVIYCNLNTRSLKTSLPRALLKHVYPVQSLNGRYYFTQDDPNYKFYAVPDSLPPRAYFESINELGEAKKDAFNDFNPGVYADNVGNVRIGFFASDNANSPDGSIPIDLNVFYIEIKWNDNKQLYEAKQTVMTKGQYGCPGIFALIEHFKQSNPYIPPTPSKGSYCILDNISSPMWLNEPDWSNISDVPLNTQKPLFTTDNQGYFEAQTIKGSCLSCQNSFISVNNDAMLKGKETSPGKERIDEYINIINNCTGNKPNKLNFLDAWTISNTTEHINATLTVTPSDSGTADGNLTFNNIDKEYTAYTTAYSVQSNNNYGRSATYTGFLVFKDLTSDGLFTEFSSVYTANFMHRANNDPLQLTQPYGVNYYKQGSNGLNYWIPSPELKTLFIGKKFTIIGDLPTDPDANDPFGPGNNKPEFPGDGETTPGGGGGSHGQNSDTITLPDFPAPEHQIISAGWSKAWAPTKTERDNLSSYLFSTNFIDNFKKQYANPMDVILKSHVVPLDPVKGSGLSLKIAGIDTGVTLTSLGNQYREFDIGSIYIPTYWNSFLDFEPYTTIELFLPFIGTYKLNTYDVINKNLSVKYRIDYYTGNCLAVVMLDGQPTYFYNSNISYEVPFSSSVKPGLIGGVVNAISGAAGIVAGATTGNPVMAISGAGGLASGIGQMIATDVNHAGGISGDVGYMSPNYFYVRIVRPVTAIPKNFGSERGYTSNITRQIGSLKGYTVVRDVKLDNINATKEEVQELDSILKGGVIL